MKNNTFYRILILLFLIVFVFSNAIVFAQTSHEPPWELIKEQGPLKVYTRYNNDSGVKELRMTTNFKASIEDFIMALDDADSYKEWVYRCESSRLVQRVSDSELYYHIETDFPFPLSDRDLVVFTSQKFDKSGIFYSDSYARPDFQPTQNGVVRIYIFESHWKVTPLKDGSIDIDYHSKVDPSGNIPLWIVNLGLTVGPVKTMESFAEFVETKKFLK